MANKLKSIQWYQSEEGRVTVGYLSNQQLFNISLEGVGGGIFGTDEEDESNGYYELSLRNILGRLFNDYDTNPCFGSVEDACIEAASILRQAVDFLSQPFRYHAFPKGIHAYIGEIKVARITLDEANLSASGVLLLRCEMSLLNLFSAQFIDYDDNYFESIDQAKNELERLRTVLIGRFADEI